MPLGDEARDAVVSLVERIRSGEPPGRGVRWVRMEGLHLTLRFLGPTPEDRVEGVADAVTRAASGFPPFSVTLARAGAFPPVGRPRTLWLDLDGGADRLADLASRLDDELETAGWDRERRPFRGHLTLARADGVPTGRATVGALVEAAAELEVISQIDRIVLFESVTGDGRARYVARAEARLG